MSVIPRVTYDMRLSSMVEHIEVPAEEAGIYLLGCGVSEDAIADTSIHVSADVMPSDNPEYLAFGVSNPRKATIFVGSYFKATEQLDCTQRDVLATVAGSFTIAHELFHIGQFERGEIPFITIGTANIPEDYDNLPWEVAAKEAEIKYEERLKNHEVGHLLFVIFK